MQNQNLEGPKLVLKNPKVLPMEHPTYPPLEHLPTNPLQVHPQSQPKGRGMPRRQGFEELLPRYGREALPRVQQPETTD